MGFLFVLISAICISQDAAKLGYDKRDIQGLAAMGPTGWFFATLFLWIFALPLYLIKRGELKAAGERRKMMLNAGYGAHHALPPGVDPRAFYGPLGPPAPPPAPEPTPAAPVVSEPRPDVDDELDSLAERLHKLSELRISGLLTDEEFEQQKARLLARI